MVRGSPYLIALAMLAQPASVHGDEGRILVPIVAPSSPLVDVSTAELQRIYLRQATEIQSAKLTPINHAIERAERECFDKKVLGMTREESGRYWIDQKIRGRGVPPKSVGVPRLLKRITARFPGVIAYIDATELDDSVKALRIDGRSYGDPKYLLRGCK